MGEVGVWVFLEWQQNCSTRRAVSNVGIFIRYNVVISAVNRSGQGRVLPEDRGVYTPRSNDPDIKIVDLDTIFYVMLSVSPISKDG